MASERAPVLVRHAGGGVEALRQLPPGFRFRPTDEELVVQYLRRKAFGVPLPAAVISVVRDLYSLDPWDVVVPGPGTTTTHATPRRRRFERTPVLSATRRNRKN